MSHQKGFARSSSRQTFAGSLTINATEGESGAGSARKVLRCSDVSFQGYVSSNICSGEPARLKPDEWRCNDL